MLYKHRALIKIFYSLFIIIFIFYAFLECNSDYIKHPISIIIYIISLILIIISYFLEKKKSKNSLDENNLINNNDIKKIDHGFDGILELDNKIPKLWFKLFYITIVISIIYFYSFLFTNFANTQFEYKIAYINQLKEIKEYEKKQPQANIETVKFDEKFINDGKKLFNENCATCHNVDGGGNIGPNLTDDYWINHTEKTLIKNVFSIIWNGSKNNKVMRAFGASGEIKGNDIQKISSYIYYINKIKKKPKNPKFPEGEKIILV
ncbi:Cytochrome c, mono- and diheme variant [Candidatus Karelsulcia muelleri DMIN]|uniref:Cytochrome c, mono-and diheme variant n=1 Tax=Karelsulcia muelleri (strain DMIN) TaxID=641892 RepID=D5D8Q9_KARMD|nr:Cytochrome c, mono- and diheme variant [Candidatus Karelsulcia muelleri DMIN]